MALIPATEVNALRERLILGLDVPGLSEAEEIVRELRDRVGMFKIGLELFCGAGPAAIDMVHRHGQRVFLDLKLHDIPNTVSGAVRRIVATGVGMFNLHAAAGHAAMAGAARSAAETAAERGLPKPIVLGVTVLTSLGVEDLRRQHIDYPLEQQVESLALQAVAAGLDGVVCAGAEARMIKKACGGSFVTVIPGVRPTWAGANDQKRAMTPAEALRNGADFLVVARPVLGADDRRAAAARILAEMEEAMDA